MIRTRDLVLFLSAILFLAMVITFTLARQQTSGSRAEVKDFAATDAPEMVGSYEENTLDRESIINRLRSAIAKNEVIALPEPEVTDEEAVLAEEEMMATTNEVVLNKCPVQTNALAFARTWPREGVMVQEAEGVRSVALVETTDLISFDEVSTAADPVINVKPLMQLPLYPVIGEAKCLSSEVVGVTVSGSLLFNSDAIAYHNRAANELIGFARDGVPIYGNYLGETDECGGYVENGQYRYSISSTRNFVLGCYKASPQSFVGE